MNHTTYNSTLTLLKLPPMIVVMVVAMVDSQRTLTMFAGVVALHCDVDNEVPQVPQT